MGLHPYLLNSPYSGSLNRRTFDITLSPIHPLSKAQDVLAHTRADAMGDVMTTIITETIVGTAYIRREHVASLVQMDTRVHGRHGLTEDQIVAHNKVPHR